MTDATDPAALLARRKKARAGHRGYTTRLLHQAKTVTETDLLDTEELLLVQEMLGEKVDTLKALDGEILEVVPEAELEEEIEHADEFRQGIYRTLAKMKKSLVSVAPSTPASGVPLAASAATGSTPGGTSTPGTARVPIPDRVKLPKISLPRFCGNHMKWTAFWDSFNSAVHENDRLSEIDKFNYLRSLLKGSAYDAIAGLALLAANYGEAVAILKKRFGNRQMIISKHMESLLAVTAVTSDQHLRELRRLYDQSEANIRSLKVLGVEPSHMGLCSHQCC